MKFEEDDKIRAMLNAIPEKDFYQIKDIHVKKKKEKILLPIMSAADIDPNKTILGKYVKKIIDSGSENTLYEITIPPQEVLEKELMLKFKNFKETNTIARKEEIRKYIFIMFFGDYSYDSAYWKKLIDGAIDIKIDSDMKKGMRRLFNLAMDEIQEKHPELLEHRFVNYIKGQKELYVSISYNANTAIDEEKINQHNMNTKLCGEFTDEVAKEYRDPFKKLQKEYSDQLIDVDWSKLKGTTQIKEILPKNIIKNIKKTIDRFEREEEIGKQKIREANRNNKKIIKKYEEKRKKLEEKYQKEHRFMVSTQHPKEEIHIPGDMDLFEAIAQHTTVSGHIINNKMHIVIKTPHTIKIEKSNMSISTSSYGSTQGKKTLHVTNTGISTNRSTPSSYSHYEDLRFFVIWDGKMPATYNIYLTRGLWKHLTSKDFEEMIPYIKSEVRHIAKIGPSE